MQFDENQVLTLISRIHSKSAELTNEKLSSKLESGETLVSSHGFILFLLAENNSMTFSQLTSKINRDKSTTTSLVKKLEKEGLVQVKQSENDSRVKLISLTEKGSRYNSETQSISKELLATAWTGFTEAEKENFTALLNKMNENLN